MRDPTAEDLEEQYDRPLERLQLLGGNDDAIAAFLERSTSAARVTARCCASSLDRRRWRGRSAFRRITAASSSHSRASAATGITARAGEELGPLRTQVRYLVELVARYVVVTFCKSVSLNLRNLYWLREMQAEPGSRERELLQPARLDAQALVEITRGREIGVPTFVIVIPAGLSVWRLATAP